MTGAGLSGEKGWVTAKPRFMSLIVVMKRKKKKGRVFGNAQGPGLLPYYQKCRRS